MGRIELAERSQPEEMTPTVAKRNAEPRGEGGKKRVANPWPQEHEPAVRPSASDELAQNSKVQQSSETQAVEPGGVRGTILHLTWGDLRGESPGEVSRGRSSEEGPVMGLERRAEEVTERS